MGIPQLTDERLRHWLDTNQLARERLCQVVLSLDRRFRDVRPRHPGGGPDGGRDLEAIFEDDRVTFGAITLVASAVGNAIFDATGARIRQVPFTPERVKAALDARGQSSSGGV